jgi:hypothetical protein
MAINEKALSKGEIRKLAALRKSLGENIANDAFAKWLENKPSVVKLTDPSALKLEAVLATLANDKGFKLGNYGYTVKKAKGKGANGFVARRNVKPS